MTFEELLDEINRLTRDVDRLIKTADWKGYLTASTRLSEARSELDRRIRATSTTATSCG